MRVSIHAIGKVAALALTLSWLTGCAVSTAPDQPKTTPPRAKAAASPNAATRPKVVATTTVLCDLTQQIAGDTVTLSCLIKPGTDPHIYQATPEDRKAIEDATLILYGGYNFEPGLIKLVNASARSVAKVAVDEVAVPNPQKFEEDGTVVIDPHVWHSAKNGIRIVDAIAKTLAQATPTHASLYTKNAALLKEELAQIDTWITSQIATIPVASRTLVTTHDALGYYSKAYGIPIASLEGVSTEEKPTAANVKELVKTIEKTHVPTIFAELSINPQLIQTVAKDARVKVSEQEIFADGLGEKGSGGDSYQTMLIANTKAIVEGLNGKYTPFNLNYKFPRSVSRNAPTARINRQHS